MTGPTPYVHFPGNAREALTFYADVFGCAVQLHTFAEFDRADGPALWQMREADAFRGPRWILPWSMGI